MQKMPGTKTKSPILHAIAKGVYVFIGGGGLTNFGLVLTKDKPVVIDSDMRVRSRFIKGMRQITRKNAGLVFNTHHNFDHTSDNRYHTLRGAVTIGSEFTRREMGPEMEKKGVAHHLRNGFNLEHHAPNLGIDPPMITFEDRLDIRYGGRLFRIIHFGHCHTKGDSVIWMPEEKILFAGDLIAYRSHTASSQGNFDNWRRALNRLKRLPARRFIPGHGDLPPGGGGIVEENIAYFNNLRRRAAAALKKESSPAKAATLVRMPECARWTRPHNLAVNALNMTRHLQRKKKG